MILVKLFFEKIVDACKDDPTHNSIKYLPSYTDVKEKPQGSHYI